MSSIFDLPLVCEYCERDYHNDDKNKCVDLDGLDFCCEDCMYKYDEIEYDFEYILTEQIDDCCHFHQFEYQVNDIFSIIKYENIGDYVSQGTWFHVFDDGDHNQQVFDNAMDAIKWCKRVTLANLRDEDGWLIHP